MKIIERKISELKPAEYNPRQLTDKQFKDLKKSLQKFGFVDPVLVNTHESRKNIIIGGHQRCKVWEALGHDTVPTVELSLPFDQEQELNVRLNKNTGQFDYETLANLFEEKDLLDWGFEDWELGVDGKPEKEEEEGKVEKEPEKEELAIIVICDNLDDQAAKMAAIASLGYVCHTGSATRQKERKRKGTKDAGEETPRGVGFKASLAR